MRIKFSNHTLLVCTAVLLVIASCTRPPELPEVPVIGFDNIEFEILNQGDPLFEQNELRLTFSVSDGNGDLGLDGDEGADNEGPYRSYTLVRENSQFIEFGQRPTDPPFTCLDYVIEDRENEDLNNDGDLLDTLLMDFNDNQYNIEVDFFVKENGSFNELDMRAQPLFSANQQTLCGITFDGRFPCLSTQDNPCDFVSGSDRPIEGFVTYAMNSSLFLPVFRTDTIKLQFKIRDRALNESNIAETPEFTLQGIQVLDQNED